jgi:hypothetical protein
MFNISVIGIQASLKVTVSTDFTNIIKGGIQHLPGETEQGTACCGCASGEQESESDKEWIRTVIWSTSVSRFHCCIEGWFWLY